MGVGDLAVPRRMQAFGEAFHGRSAAYDLAVSYGREALARAICTYIANGQDNAYDKDNVRRRAADAALAHRDGGAMVNGSRAFPLAVNRGVKL
jgi:cytochrome b pre-mRNA-processing protein 3